MEKKFILNANTGVLHYKGFFCKTNSISGDKENYRCFEDENHARSEYALSVRWCKNCAKKRK